MPSPGAVILRGAGPLWMPQGLRMRLRGPRASTGPDDDSAHRKDHLRRIVGHNEENFPKQSVLSTTCLPPSAQLLLASNLQALVTTTKVGGFVFPFPKVSIPGAQQTQDSILAPESNTEAANKAPGHVQLQAATSE